MVQLANNNRLANAGIVEFKEPPHRPPKGKGKFMSLTEGHTRRDQTRSRDNAGT
jgi:hypothetical protein